MLRLDTWLSVMSHSPGKSRVCTHVAFHTMLKDWLVASLDQDMAAFKDHPLVTVGEAKPAVS